MLLRALEQSRDEVVAGSDEAAVAGSDEQERELRVPAAWPWLDRRYLVGFVAGALVGMAVGIPGAYAIAKLRPDVSSVLAPPRALGAKVNSFIDQGLVALRDKRPARALWAFHKAARLAPNQPNIENNLCAAFNELGRYGDAITACNKALALRPDFPLARRNLAWAQSQLSKAKVGLPPSQP
jgi:tetratricopeptide (TPR) repeat protein